MAADTPPAGEQNVATTERVRRWWWHLTPQRQDRLAVLAPLAAVVLFLAAIIASFGYLRLEEIDPVRHAGNRREPWRILGRVPNPSRTLLAADQSERSMTDHIMAHFWSTRGVPAGDGVEQARHGQGAGYVYLDTHAETRPFEDTFSLTSGLDQWNPDPARH